MKEWQSEITEIGVNELFTRGVNQRDIVRSYTFEDMIFLLLQARAPSPVERDMLRAVIVSHISHGITGQSTLAVRMAADCRATFLSALIAGFSTGSGPFHQGGLEATMRELQKLIQVGRAGLEVHLRTRMAAGELIMGFGHRFHKGEDPRAVALLEVAARNGFTGPHIEIARQVAEILQTDKRIPMNIEAAGGSILLDMGFLPDTAHLFIILGRSTMFAAAFAERIRDSPVPFPKIRVFDMEAGD